MTLRPNGGGAAGQRWTCRENTGDRAHCYSTKKPDSPVPIKTNGKPSKQRPLLFRRKVSKRVIVVTAAQNATPVHEASFKALEQYCNHRSADLIAVPLMYKNPTSRWEAEEQESDRWWDPRIKPYLCNTRKRLNKNLVLLGDVPVQPTAVNPLTGFEAITHGESGILGHTKLALKTIATPQGRMPKILTTTGAITQQNYSQSKAGKMGEFHHTLGATVIELDGSKFHMRQLGMSKNGSFYDLDTLYGADWTSKPVKEMRPLALVMGDTHARNISQAVKRATFGRSGGMIDELEPRELIWHDLVDGVTHNPHARGNFLIDSARSGSNNSNVEREIAEALQFVVDNSPKADSYIVPSNHNDWLHRWILANDWRLLDPDNRSFYLETAAKLDKLARGCTPDQAERLDAFIVIAKERLAEHANIHVLEYDESHMVGSIETGMHGHLGPNGARGSLRNLRRIGVKSVSGHEHSPGIDEGAWRVGTSTDLRRGYTKGPSSWLQTHCLIYANGKRTLLNIIDDDWRAR